MTTVIEGQSQEVVGGLPVVKPTVAGQYVKLLVYGRPGVGKTVLGASADDSVTGPALILDVEAGTMSVQDRYPNVDVFPIRNFAIDMAKAFEYLTSKQNKYRTVVVDSITEVQKLSMMGIMITIAQTKPDRDPD